mgnify:CR=1 FL=1
MNMKRRGCATGMILAVLTALLLSPAACGAEQHRDMQHLLPPDIDIFLRWRNPAGTRAYRESALGGLLKEPEMKRFVEHANQKLAKALGAVAQDAPVDIPMARDVLGHGFSVAVRMPSQTASGPPRPALVLSAGFSVSAQEMENRLLGTLRQVAPSDFREPEEAFKHSGHVVKKLGQRQQPVFYTFMDGRWIAATGRELMTGILDRTSGEGDSLADRATFNRAMDRAGGADASLSLYLNADKLLASSQAFMPAMARKLLGKLDLDAIKAVAATSRFADGGMRDSIYALAPERSGALLPPAGATVDADLLKLVPKNARTMSLSRTDLLALYRAILDAWKTGAPSSAQQAMNLRDRWEKKVGFDIEQDLLGSLGKQLLFYSTPHGHAAAVAVRHREQFDSCLSSLAEAYSEKIQMKTLEYRGHTIRHVDVTAVPFVVTPSYTYHRGMAVFGLWPQALKRFIAHVEEGEPSIRQGKDFRRVCGDAPGEKAAVQYSDIDDDLVSFYDLLVIGMQALNGLPRANIRPELFPSSRVMEPHVFGAGTTWATDPQGLLMETYSPFGTAGTVMAGLGALGRIYTENASMSVPILAGMLMPALQRARRAARQTACMNNMRQVGTALAMWKNDHDGKLPEGLAELHPEYVKDKDLFTCPRDTDPFTIGDGIPCSYHYIGPLPHFDGSIQRIVAAYEDPDNHAEGRNVLFADWHVERLQEERLGMVLERSLQALKEGPWEELSEERREEVRRFHSPGSR